MSLSAKNGWLDEDGRVYKIFTRKKYSLPLAAQFAE
jgi:hypothetical protein